MPQNELKVKDLYNENYKILMKKLRKAPPHTRHPKFMD
jgi:hypothetical protein